MARKILGLITLTICLLGLTGCVFGSVDEMYALPKSSEAYVNLQAKINEEKGNNEYIAPLSGENRQTIQLVDMDGDGAQEAVAFFRDNSSDAPLKIVIFKMDDRQEYQVCARIEGVGSEIESIDYLNLCGTPGMDILVSWQVSASVHTLVGYSIAGGEPVEIHLVDSAQKAQPQESAEEEEQREMETAEREGVDVRLYKVIYNAIKDVQAAMKGMLDPVFEEKILGHAEVRQIFKASGVGNIAGSYVLDGVFQRNCKIRITREGEQIYEGSLASLKRFKDDVKEVKAGYECGLVFDGFNDIQELDIVEAYTMVEVPR